MLTLLANRLSTSIYELLWFQVLHVCQCCVSLALRKGDGVNAIIFRQGLGFLSAKQVKDVLFHYNLLSG